MRGRHVRPCDVENLRRAVAAVARLRLETPVRPFSNPSSRPPAAHGIPSLLPAGCFQFAPALLGICRKRAGVCTPQRHAQHCVLQPRL